MKKAVSVLILLFSIAGLYASGQNDKSDTVAFDSVIAESEKVPDWSVSTHSMYVEPNYSIVFNQSEILEFYIVIDSTDWQAMQDNLRENIPSETNFPRGPGDGRQPPQGGPGEPPADRQGEPPADRPGEPPADRQGEPPADRPGEVSQVDFDTIWVPSSVTFDNTTWDHVGIRFKGNSSLRSAVNSGNNKLSFKLDFDEFEDDYPETNNQRFYGFKQLNLNNNYDDESLMREKVGADLFREIGLVSAQTTFCVVYLDHGEGSQFFGVYTLVEEMDDTVIKTQLGDDRGNLYKPDGNAATFASGTYNEDEMVKKSNEEGGDYSDVFALYELINRDDRITDIDSWKSDLEEVFNVDGFLKWLAANTVMQNWDSYGKMNHNYFLYNNPETGLLNWIPWDNNESLNDRKSRPLSLTLTEVDQRWPFIRYLIDDAAYKAVYNSYVKQFAYEVFNPEKMKKTYSDYYKLLKEYAYEEIPGYTYLRSDQSFDSAVEELKSHVEQRFSAVESYLDS